MLSSYKYLLKNIGFLTISQFATKILSFFLVPLYTNVLSAAEYGTYDLFVTTINLLIPIFTLNVCESIVVYTMDKDCENNQVISVGIKYSILGFVGSYIFLFINYLVKIFPALNEFWYFFPILFLLTVINSSFTYFARGIDRVKDTAISGVLSSGILILSNIIFLLIIKIGLLGYFISQILSLIVQILYLFFSCKIYNYIIWNIDKKTENDMKKFSYPLIANNIGWWINNSADRYVVTLICGIASNGIYSVGYKIPSILNMFQTIFSQAWTISAIKDFDSEDKNGFFSNMYSIYNGGMVIVCSLIIVSSKLLAHILYAKDFFIAWKYVPWLTISIVFGSVSGYLGGIFSAVKDSKMFGKSTIVGAVVNIILDVILVYAWGSIGAAIATAISYFVVWIMRFVHVKKYINFKINILRDSIAYIILVIQGGILYIFFDNEVILYSVEIVTFAMLITFFKNEIKMITNKLIVYRK